MSVEKTLTERGTRYGDFTDTARLSQDLKRVMQNFAPESWTTSAPWLELSDVQRQALELFADKIARILNGDPNYADNWHDIQGYAKLVEDRLPKAMPATFGQQNVFEPASEIDDESDRIQAIGQNGNSGEHYDQAEIDRKAADYEKLERWKGAPYWAKWWAVDRVCAYWYEFETTWESAGKYWKAYNGLSLPAKTLDHQKSTPDKESRPCAN